MLHPPSSGHVAPHPPAAPCSTLAPACLQVAVLCISLAGLCVGSTVTFVAARLVLRMRQANLRSVIQRT